MRESVNKILAASEPKGNVDKIDSLIDYAQRRDDDAIVLLGDLSKEDQEVSELAEMFKHLGKANIPTFYIPGENDAPIVDFQREAYNIELVYPTMHGVHGNMAFAPRYILVAGMGGALFEQDQNAVSREIKEALRYGTWEVEYQFKFISELKSYPRIFLFNTPPQHPQESPDGNEDLTQLIHTHNPQLVVANSESFFSNWLGSSFYVSPGTLKDNSAALINLRDRTAEKVEL